MAEDDLKNLLRRFFNGELSEAEKEELSGWVNRQDDDDMIDELLEKSWADFSTEERLPEDLAAGMLRNILAESKQRGADTGGRVVRLFWRHIAVAASVLLLLGTGAYFFLNQRSEDASMVQVSDEPQDVTPPETNRATITLADGSTVYLDELNDGEVARQGNISVVKLENGKIAYQTESGEILNELQYNTLSNPRGSRVIDMKLSDGTHVWLNAGSSITYPVAFVGNTRDVQLTGEGYFDVTTDKIKPFRVSAGGMQVEVLGTEFNVNAYDDEESVKTTLIAGSVKVLSGTNAAMLKPGQQSDFRNGRIHVNDGANTEAATAWLKGNFYFDNTSLQEVMRQISRWYDMDVVFTDAPMQRTFSGAMKRDLRLRQAMRVLEYNDVKYSIVGKQIIISQ